MTQDEIIKMLRKSGAIVTPMGFVTEPPTLTVVDVMERFAKLVAAEEREACAKFIEHDYVRQFERPWRDDLSAAIRARGQA
jgi:hypothetical protein